MRQDPHWVDPTIMLTAPRPLTTVTTMEWDPCPTMLMAPYHHITDTTGPTDPMETMLRAPCPTTPTVDLTAALTTQWDPSLTTTATVVPTEVSSHLHLALALTNPHLSSYLQATMVYIGSFTPLLLIYYHMILESTDGLVLSFFLM